MVCGYEDCYSFVLEMDCGCDRLFGTPVFAGDEVVASGHWRGAFGVRDGDAFEFGFFVGLFLIAECAVEGYEVESVGRDRCGGCRGQKESCELHSEVG